MLLTDSMNLVAELMLFFKKKNHEPLENWNLQVILIIKMTILKQPLDI